MGLSRALGTAGCHVPPASHPRGAVPRWDGWDGGGGGGQHGTGLSPAPGGTGLEEKLGTKLVAGGNEPWQRAEAVGEAPRSGSTYVPNNLLSTLVLTPKPSWLWGRRGWKGPGKGFPLGTHPAASVQPRLSPRSFRPPPLDPPRSPHAWHLRHCLISAVQPPFFPALPLAPPSPSQLLPSRGPPCRGWGPPPGAEAPRLQKGC